MTYHIYHKEKLGIIESIYDFCFFFRFEPLRIVEIQIDNILILINNNFASTKKKQLN